MLELHYEFGRWPLYVYIDTRLVLVRRALRPPLTHKGSPWLCVTVVRKRKGVLSLCQGVCAVTTITSDVYVWVDRLLSTCLGVGGSVKRQTNGAEVSVNPSGTYGNYCHGVVNGQSVTINIRTFPRMRWDAR